MENFQLYKTSPLLGGQLKWDLVLENAGNKLYVKDFHLTPISPQVPYNRYSDDDLLNYSHQENVKSFYKKIESSFYQDYIDPQLSHDWPIITDENIKPYDDTFFMGCKRGSYQLYNKQFEFFVPLWLEKIEDGLVFTININDINGNLVASQSLELSDNINDVGYHKKFWNYLKNYFKYISIYDQSQNYSTSTDIININLSNKTAYITGLNVSTGESVTKDISSLVQNLLLRERPLLEFDSMITNSIQDNKLILKQLFNFNLCFNFEDIISHILSTMVYGEQFSIEVNVKMKVGEEYVELEKRDIYTNFEYIPKTQINSEYGWEFNSYNDIFPVKYETIPSNVLDYLKDSQCVDFVNVNKIVQKIPHWQLENNQNYIFNVYNGFSAEYDGKSTSHYYNETPNTEQFKYDIILNNCGWANIAKMSDNNLANVLNLPSNYLTYLTNLNGWAKGLYYNSAENIYVGLGWYEDDPLETGETGDEIEISIRNTDGIIGFEGINGSNYRVYIGTNYPDNIEYPTYIIWSRDKNNLTFASVKKILEENLVNITETSNLNNLIPLLNAIQSLQNIPMVVLNQGLYVVHCDSPSLSSSEIEYYKRDDDFLEYILRYDGKIKPNFILEPINFIYSKYYGTESELRDVLGEQFFKYSNSGFTPQFPSINYFSLKHYQLGYDWDAYLNFYKVWHKNPENQPLESYYPDIKWFNSGRSLILTPYISKAITTYDNNGDGSISTEEINNSIKNTIMNFYKLTENDPKIDYIISQYNITYDLQETSFEENSNLTIFKYIVKFNLK